MTVLLNLYGGPCSGKSTLSLEVASALKKNGHSVYLVREYFTDLILDGLEDEENAQRQSLLNTIEEIKRAEDKVDYIVCESPVYLNLVYCKEEEREEFLKIIEENSFSCKQVNYFCPMYVDSYKEVNRIHSLEEALKVQVGVLKLDRKYDLFFNHRERIYDLKGMKKLN